MRIQLDNAISTFNQRPKILLDLKLPPHSHCVDMAEINNNLICIFDLPDRGFVTFLIDFEKKEAYEFKPASNDLMLVEGAFFE